MKAVTKTEIHAIETAAPLEVADPTKNLILVPLSQLLSRHAGTVDGLDHYRRPPRTGSGFLRCSSMAAQPIRTA
ncbi:hypothetical protein [Burkholderia gladioli]|uniref:hypothetical protein n=1 Tax=Burkholderia gladioli TaxID=28095 RepID=UPI003F5471B9